jgi:hypothetical protein
MAVHAYNFRGRTGVHIVERWHALATWAVDCPDGSQFTGTITCQHDHLDEPAAIKCQSRLSYRIEHNPHLFPEVQRALDDATKMEDQR